MNSFRWFGIASFFLTVTAGLAHSYGPAPRVTGAPGDDARACTQCHAGTLNSGTGSVKITLPSGLVYIPGIKQRVTVQVSDPNQQRWGFELTARLNSAPDKGQAGDFTPVDNLTQVICEDAGPKPCSGVSFVQHTSAGTRNGTKGGATFQVDWTPPLTDVGPVTLYAAGNAANGNGTNAGDLIYTTSVQLTPVLPAAPSVAAGNIVSAATGVAGPVSQFSWVSIYGTNLSATTRGWTDSDLNNGALPTALDGVGVILTFNGASRLASIGYISPNQVNFLVPSDASNNTAQVQVKNPAGLSTAVPQVVQATAPQLLSLDGKYVSGSHADGTVLGKTGLLASVPSIPAAPGEIVNVYGTGCGPAAPALIPSQLPTQAFPLATLPQVKIGTSTATVSKATVITGVAGVCQISVQVPTDAPNGDLPVTVSLGTFTSAATLITVQK